MAASVAIASMLALLATNGTSQLDCICNRIHNQTNGGQALWDATVSEGERSLWEFYCHSSRPTARYNLVERCETLELAPAALAAVSRLVPWDWSYGPPPAGDGLGSGQPPAEGGDCGAVLAEIRALTWKEIAELQCYIADFYTDYCSAQRLNDTKWTAETLATDHLRYQKMSQLLHAVQHITTNILMMRDCLLGQVTIHDIKDKATGYLQQLSRHWRGYARLLPLAVAHLSQLFIPLAFEHMRNLMNDQQLHGRLRNLERVRDMLDTKLRGLVHDAQFISEQIANYKVDEDKKNGKYIIRRPLLSHALLVHQERLLSFRDDFGALCEQQQPHASQVFGIADALYSFYRSTAFPNWRELDAEYKIIDEEWQLEDQINTTVSVDAGCLQLLVDAVDRPRCPLEDLPLEESRRRRQCREQLWQDLVERSPHVPATQRANVSLCLLAWMATDSYGVCQDVPFSIVQAVHDARCFFDSPDNQTCLQSNTTDAICHVSKAILLLKCPDFATYYLSPMCHVSITTTGVYSNTTNGSLGWEWEAYKVYGKPTLRYKHRSDRPGLYFEGRV